MFTVSVSNNLKSQFSEYPFPKHLMVNVKNGHYLVISMDGTQEVIAADNAKDALDKTTLKNVIKLEYLGFYKKVIFNTQEVSEDTTLTTDSDPVTSHNETEADTSENETPKS